VDAISASYSHFNGLSDPLVTPLRRDEAGAQRNQRERNGRERQHRRIDTGHLKEN
jgi:hypothetical protein